MFIMQYYAQLCIRLQCYMLKMFSANIPLLYFIKVTCSGPQERSGNISSCLCCFADVNKDEQLLSFDMNWECVLDH